MSELRLTVHRATQEIGGNCVEIADDAGHRIILDVGRPLDKPGDAASLLPKSLDLSAPCDGVLVSHAHQDHFGLLRELPALWPVYCGEATEVLLRMTMSRFGPPVDHAFKNWSSGHPMQIGPFNVTSFLTDHSAFDSYMMLIEAHGRRILYSGDFRRHGRKGVLVKRLMASPPPDVDVLLMEGTNLGTDKPWMSEDDLEEEFTTLFRLTRGRVFVAWSAQNIDRVVTLYRACLKSNRTLVIDLYAAEVLKKLAKFGELPQPDWRNIKVVITAGMARMYKRSGEEAFVQRMVLHGIAARTLCETPDEWVVMIRRSLIGDYTHSGVQPNIGDAWCWSMWSGYLKNEDGRSVRQWFEAGGAIATHIHTSGHASPADLRAFSNRVAPKWMVPIHGAAWDTEVEGFPPIRRLVDGETMNLRGGDFGHSVEVGVQPASGSNE